MSNFEYEAPDRRPVLDEAVHSVDGVTGLIRAVVLECEGGLETFVFVVRWDYAKGAPLYEVYTEVAWRLGIVRPGPYVKVVAFADD